MSLRERSEYVYIVYVDTVYIVLFPQFIPGWGKLVEMIYLWARMKTMLAEIAKYVILRNCAPRGNEMPLPDRHTEHLLGVAFIGLLRIFSSR
jgi:hypothetical protein